MKRNCFYYCLKNSKEDCEAYSQCNDNNNNNNNNNNNKKKNAIFRCEQIVQFRPEDQI